MDVFYVDAAGEFESESTIELVGHDELRAESQQNGEHEQLRRQFPEGLTRYGQECSYADLRTVTSPITIAREWVFELHRQNNFASYVPSRFQSAFVYETLQGAKRHARSTLSEGAYEIYAVDVDDPSGPYYTGFLGGSTIPELMALAESYWEGIPHQNGVRQYLVEPPIELGTHVDTVAVRPDG